MGVFWGVVVHFAPFCTELLYFASFCSIVFHCGVLVWAGGLRVFCGSLRIEYTRSVKDAGGPRGELVKGGGVVVDGW